MIAHLKVFAGLDEQQLLELAVRAQLQRIDRKTTVLRRGEPMPGIIGVGYGLLKLAARGANGEERILLLLETGATFGTAAVVLRRPCPVDLVALSDTLLVTLAPTTIFNLIERDPRFARSLMVGLAEGNLGLVSEFANSMLQSGVQRLASFLSSLARPVDGSGRWVAALPVAKAIVASRLGMKKETLSRLLQRLAREGLVAVEGREIQIPNRDRLVQIASPTACPAPGRKELGEDALRGGRSVDRADSSQDAWRNQAALASED